jgi:hypothetical protein
VYGVLTAISLADLTQGIAASTHLDGWRPAALAVSVDLGLTALKAATILTHGATRRQVEVAAHWPIIGVLVLSAGLNARALSEHAAPLSADWLLGIGLGLGVTSLLYACLHVVDVLHNASRAPQTRQPVRKV